jgi:hypothetical protein
MIDPLEAIADKGQSLAGPAKFLISHVKNR